jgi:hypothetical protein
MMATEDEPRRVVPSSTESNPEYAHMWYAPGFSLDDDDPVVTRQNLECVGNSFVLSNVLSSAEAARMVAMAEKMSFVRSKGDEAERNNGAVSWVLHEELAEQLLRRLAPCLPLAVMVHSPGTPVPEFDDTYERLNGIPTWVREVSGAPEGAYTLDAVSGRCRIYRYDSDTPDSFLPHHDEVWPGSRLELVENQEPALSYDSWKYNSAANGAWAWSEGDRISHLSVLLYLNDDFGGGQTLLHPEAVDSVESGQPRFAVTPVTGSALCFGQTFKLGRAGVQHSQDAMLHEGLPVVSLRDRPKMMRAPPKYILRTDVCYTMPTPPIPAPSEGRQDADSSEKSLADPRAPEEKTVELSADPEIRAKQLALLKEYGYDVSAFE